MKNILILGIVLVLIFGLYGYTQYLKKSLVIAVLMQRIDLSNPPGKIFAIITDDQNLSDGKKLPKGTKLLGNLTKENGTYVIYFDEIQALNGKAGKLTGKSNLNIREIDQSNGVSARIGKTLSQQTKTNVLGAIFNNPAASQSDNGEILQRGSAIKVEID